MLSFFNDTATTEIYTLSLHDALPIWIKGVETSKGIVSAATVIIIAGAWANHLLTPLGIDLGLVPKRAPRSEEHTSELQSQSNLVCRLLLEKKKNMSKSQYNNIT